MRILSFVLFALVATALTAALHYYLWARLVRDPAWGEPVQRALTWLVIALGVLLPGSMIVTRFGSDAWLRIVAWVAFSWMGLLFLLFMATVAAELGRVPAAFVDADRRLLITRSLALGAAALGLGTGALGIRQALLAVQVKELEIPLERLPIGADGLVIAQLTDIHVGPTIGRDFIEALVEKTNALSPDIIAITGDLVDGSVAQLRAHVAPLENLRARYGVFFVTGNHEYYSGVDDWLDELRRIGIRPLRNEHVAVGPEGATFDLAGVDDWSAHQFGGDHGHDLKKAMAGRDTARECVLLAHQPKAVIEASAHGVGLQLSGHTHGGQIWPWGYAVRLQQRYVVGLYREGDTHLYVSAGTGYWGPPMRVGTRAEITKLVLRSKPVA